jgi:predicted Zn-dependent protease
MTMARILRSGACRRSTRLAPGGGALFGSSAPTLLLAALLLPAGGCAVNPLTGARQVVLIGEGQEIQMGQQAAGQIAQSIGLVPDSALQQWVQTLGVRMGTTSERPDLPWTFRVLDDPTPNAFALPGGFIFFTRGMMALFHSEAQFVSVLGHEIAHVTARHSVVAISRAQLTQLGFGIATILVPELEPFGGLAGAGLELLFLRHSRGAEREADVHGFRYAAEHGYNAGQMADVFVALRRLGDGAGRSPLPSWAQTHPTPADRIVEVQQMVAANPGVAQLRVGRDEYLQRIEGMIHGANPRHGIFEGNVFMHPDLRFQVNFPANWPAQNLPQVVFAASPRNDGAIQLTLEPGTPEQAAQRFVAHQAVQSPGATRETINGIPAISATFQATTQQGMLAGLALWLSYEGRTYQLLGVAPAQAYRGHLDTFRQSLGSFRPLTDPRVLGLQPNRLRIQRLPEAMTLAQFHQRYPSAVPIEELAILNQVEAPGTLIPAGTLLKRITQ